MNYFLLICYATKVFYFNFGDLCQLNKQKTKLDNPRTDKKIMRRPGVEPGSTAWKATMLTVTPPTP